MSAAVKLPRIRTRDASGLLDALASRFTSLIATSTDREVATVLWALAKAGRPAPRALLAQLASQPHRGLLRGACPHALANILWSLGTWRNRGPEPLLALLLERCADALPAFKPQDTANVLWALGRLSLHPGSLLPALVATATGQARVMSPQGLATSAWACRRLRHYDGAFLRAAAAAFRARLDDASPTDLALFTSSLAGLHYRCHALLRAVAQRCCGPPPVLFAPAKGGNAPPDAPERTAGAAASEAQAEAGVGRAGARDGSSAGAAAPAGRATSESRAGGRAVGRSSAGLGAGWTARCRQRLLWAFATLDFRHESAVRALVAPDLARQPDDSSSSSSSSTVGWHWGWDPGETGAGGDAYDDDDYDTYDGVYGTREHGNGGTGLGARHALSHSAKEASAPLAASTFIWCMARLRCGRQPGPEQQAVLAAAEALWVARGRVGLSHAAIAAWGLERLGLGGQDRILSLACDRLAEALEPGYDTTPGGSDAGGAGGGEGHAIASSAAAPAAAGQEASVELSPGDLDAAVMVLWVMGRRGQLDGRVLDGFARGARRLMPRLGSRQLPTVCCAFVQLGRSDPEVLATAAEVLLAGQPPQPATMTVTAAAEGGASGKDSGSESGSAQDGSVAARRAEGSDGEGKGRSGGRGGGGGGGEDQGLLDCLPRNGLAMTLWALASSGHASPALMQRAATTVMRLFPPVDRAPSAGQVATPAPVSYDDVPDGSHTVEGSSLSGSSYPEDWGWSVQPMRAVTPQDVDRRRGSSGRSSRRSSGRRDDSDGNNRARVRGVSDASSARADEDQAPSSLWGNGGLEDLHTSWDDDEEEEEGGNLDAGAAPSAGAVGCRWAALLLCAFAAADCYSALLYDTLLAYVLVKVPLLGPGRVAVVLWACAVAGHYRRDALETLCAALQEGMGRLPSASFTQGNWAVAHLSAGLCLSWRGPGPTDLASLAPRLSRHQAAVLLWTLAVQQLVLAEEDPRGFGVAVDRLLRRLGSPGPGVTSEPLSPALTPTALAMPTPLRPPAPAPGPVGGAGAGASTAPESGLLGTGLIGGERPGRSPSHQRREQGGGGQGSFPLSAWAGMAAAWEQQDAYLSPRPVTAPAATAAGSSGVQSLDAGGAPAVHAAGTHLDAKRRKHERGLDGEAGEGCEGKGYEGEGVSSGPLEPGVALIVAEALALLLLSPHPTLRNRVERYLAEATAPPPPRPRPAPRALRRRRQFGFHSADDASSKTALPGDDAVSHDASGVARQPQAELQLELKAPAAAAANVALVAASGHREYLRRKRLHRRADRAALGSQLVAAWQRSQRRRHPQQAAVAAAARQLGYAPRLLRTHRLLPLALPTAVELPDAGPRRAVVLLAEPSDFASNVAGQPLGPLFTTVQLLQERGWMVAVVLAQRFASLGLASRRVRYLRQLLTAAGVTGSISGNNGSNSSSTGLPDQNGARHRPSRRVAETRIT